MNLRGSGELRHATPRTVSWRKTISGRFSMQRPRGVTAIAVLFSAAALYLGTIAVVKLLAPESISLMSGSPLMYGLELAGPYMALLIGCVYGVVAWGLFGVRNWARWIAMLIVALSITPLVAKISQAELGIQIFWYGLQIAVRAAAAWYLAQAPSVLDAFTKK